MSYYGKEPVNELWAILDKDGSVMCSRGGSSTSPKLMVNPSEKKMRAILNNTWIKQILKGGERVERIWVNP